MSSEMDTGGGYLQLTPTNPSTPADNDTPIRSSGGMTGSLATFYQKAQNDHALEACHTTPNQLNVPRSDYPFRAEDEASKMSLLPHEHHYGSGDGHHHSTSLYTNNCYNSQEITDNMSGQTYDLDSRKGSEVESLSSAGAFSYHHSSRMTMLPSNFPYHSQSLSPMTAPVMIGCQHRQSTPIGSTGAASTLHGNPSLYQGPYRCTRINPQNGNPCNTVFSRPYDLTRHEETIHNTTREKVRCEICNNEKTFSRPDALTRHKKIKHGIEIKARK